MTGNGSDLLRNVQTTNRERENRQRDREAMQAEDREPVTHTPNKGGTPPPARKNHV